MRPIYALVLVQAIFLAGCTGATTPTSTSLVPSSPVPSTSVTSDVSTTSVVGADGPGSCNSQEARGLVAKFLAGYNEGGGDGAGLTNLFFAPADRFQWYSDEPSRLGESARDRASLDAYFAERHEAGDQLTLTEFWFTGYRELDNTGHFAVALLRGNETRMHGKGAIDCESSKIMVWSIGREQ